MKVTIKVKHLVATLLSMGVVLMLLQYVVVPKLQLYNAKKEFEQGSVSGKENLLRVIDSSSDTQKWALIRKYMIEPGADSAVYGYNVFVGPGSVQTQSVTINPDAPIWSGEERLPYLEAYLAGAPADGYLVRASKQLANDYSSKSQRSKALAALEHAEIRLDDNYANDKRALKLERAKLYTDSDEYNKAEQLLSELTNRMNPMDTYLNNQIVKLRTHILIIKGDIKSAYEKVSLELSDYKKAMEQEKKRFPEKGNFTSADIYQLTLLKASLKSAWEQYGNTASTVSGTVRRSDGTPMVGIGVFLRERQTVNQSVTDGEPYQVMTDDQGHYEFKGVLPESYQIYIGLLFDQIDGWTWPVMDNEWIDIQGGEKKTQDITLQRLIDIQSPANYEVVTGKTIKFQWQPVEGAAYYQLNGAMPVENGTLGSVLRTNIVNNSIELPVESLYDSASGFSYKQVGDNLVVDPVTLLGYANPDSGFSWNVEAYDKAGRLLTRSNGYRLNENTIGALPFFYLKERMLTEADRLLLSGELDKAMAAYKKSYEADQGDRHNLRMIIKLYEAKASSMSKSDGLSEESLSYLEQMAKTDPSGNYISKLIYHYYKNEDWMKVDQYYSLLVQARQGFVEDYEQSIYATALMKQGRLKEARVQFEQALAQDKSHRFIGPYLAIDLYEKGTFEVAKKLASLYPERSFGEMSPLWLELIQGLENEAALIDASTYWKELKEKLEWYYGGDRKQIDSWTSTTKLSAMKAFIMALLEVD